MSGTSCRKMRPNLYALIIDLACGCFSKQRTLHPVRHKLGVTRTEGRRNIALGAERLATRRSIDPNSKLPASRRSGWCRRTAGEAFQFQALLHCLEREGRRETGLASHTLWHMQGSSLEVPRRMEYQEPSVCTATCCNCVCVTKPTEARNPGGKSRDYPIARASCAGFPAAHATLSWRPALESEVNVGPRRVFLWLRRSGICNCVTKLPG